MRYISNKIGCHVNKDLPCFIVGGFDCIIWLAVGVGNFQTFRSKT